MAHAFLGASLNQASGGFESNPDRLQQHDRTSYIIVEFLSCYCHIAMIAILLFATGGNDGPCDSRR